MFCIKFDLGLSFLFSTAHYSFMHIISTIVVLKSLLTNNALQLSKTGSITFVRMLRSEKDPLYLIDGNSLAWRPRETPQLGDPRWHCRQRIEINKGQWGSYGLNIFSYRRVSGERNLGYFTLYKLLTTFPINAIDFVTMCRS